MRWTAGSLVPGTGAKPDRFDGSRNAGAKAMTSPALRWTALSAAALLGLTAAACTQQTETPAAEDTAADTASTTTVIEREVPTPTAPVVVEREVPVPTPPVVVERDKSDTTTVRAGENGLEVETTNR